MPDMLVNLLKLPPVEPLLEDMRQKGVALRRAQPFEMTALRKYVAEQFAVTWADEITVGLSNKPVSVYVAVREGRLVGFGAYECTRRGFFGPTGVSESERGTGIGKALLIACLWGLREMGYVYGIIGGAGPTEFYARAVGAVEIPDSVPGIYVDMLKKEPDST
jgi:GNAT superfamily N-acetyltransferase